MRSLTGLAWRNLTAQPLRSGLTTLAIALGVAMALAAIMVGQAANRAANELTASINTDTSLGLSQPADPQAISMTRTFLQGGLVMVGSLMFCAAAFVMFNALAMSVTARTQTLGALRALGMTRGQVAQLVLSEAGLTGLAGAGIGIVFGIALAWVITVMLGGVKLDTLTVPGWGVALSAGAGLITALAGAGQPARQASRVSPLTALITAVPPIESSWYVRSGGRVGAGLLLILLSALTAIALLLKPVFFPALALTLAGSLGGLVAMVLLLPAAVAGLAHSLRPLLTRWLGVAGRLAADNLMRNKLRAVLTAGAFMAVFAMLIGTSSLIPMMIQGGMRGFVRMMHEDIFVMPDITADLATGKFSINTGFEWVAQWQAPPAALAALAPLIAAGQIQTEQIGFALVPPEIASYTGGRLGAFVDTDLYLQHGNFDFFVGDPDTAAATMRRGRGVLLGLTPASQLNVTVGDMVQVKTSQGPVDFTVAGIGGTGFMMPIFSYADGEKYFGVQHPAWVGLYVPPGQAVDSVLAQVQTAIQPFPGALALRPNSSADMLSSVIDRFLALLNALLLLAVFVAALGVVNTMTINVAERRREIALLRAVGATRHQIRIAIVAEAAALGFMAALIAIGVSLLMLGLFVLLMTPGGTPSLGIRVSWDLAAIALEVGFRHLALYGTLTLLLGPLAAALAAYYPARQAAAQNIIAATGADQ